MAITCKRCSKPAVVRAQVSSSMLGVLSDDPLCAVHEQAERATVAMQGGLTKVEFLPLDEPTTETPVSTEDPIRAVLAMAKETAGASNMPVTGIVLAGALEAVLDYLDLNEPHVSVVDIGTLRAIISRRLAIVED